MPSTYLRNLPAKPFKVDSIGKVMEQFYVGLRDMVGI